MFEIIYDSKKEKPESKYCVLVQKHNNGEMYQIMWIVPDKSGALNLTFKTYYLSESDLSEEDILLKAKNLAVVLDTVKPTAPDKSIQP